MKQAKVGAVRQHVLRDFEFVHAGADGAYWQAADGMVVRVAAAEHPRAQAREAESSEISPTLDAPKPAGA